MHSTGLFEQIADRWQTTIEDQREYTIVRDGNIFGTSLSDTCLFRSDYIRAAALKERLLGKWEGATLEEAIPGVEVDTVLGSCYRVQTTERVALPAPDNSLLRETLLGDLKLIFGIGPRTEKHLKQRGFQTIPDLLHHSCYRQRAQKFLDLYENQNTNELIRWIRRWYPASHPALLRTLAFHKPEDLVFFDIETLGLFSRPVVLIGTGSCLGDRLIVTQYLIRNIGEEKGALQAVCDLFSEQERVLVTFNGRAFDIPYCADRAAYYGLAGIPDLPHYDLLHQSRGRWRHTLSNCRLQTLEQKICGITRDDDVPGAMVPEFYAAYQKTGNPGPLIPIVEHNRQDISTLVRLLAVLMEGACGHR
jgi:uncharacterized protein YprB with RNaseH-like and TPR domain